MSDNQLFREVTLDGDSTIRIFPVRYNHSAQLRKLIEPLSKAIGDQPLALLQAGTEADTDTDGGPAKGQAADRLIPVVIKLILEQGMELVDDCCQPKLSEANPTLGKLAEIVATFVELNFDELEGARPLFVRLFAKISMIAASGESKTPSDGGNENDSSPQAETQTPRQRVGS